jgi:hypothetical protein
MNAKKPTPEDLEASLRTSYGTVLGSDLAAHLKRDGVLFIDRSLDLITCGIAIAQDEAALVSTWLGRGLVRRPTAEERERWLETPDRQWLATVVQPYVLIQELD